MKTDVDGYLMGAVMIAVICAVVLVVAWLSLFDTTRTAKLEARMQQRRDDCTALYARAMTFTDSLLVAQTDPPVCGNMLTGDDE